LAEAESKGGGRWGGWEEEEEEELPLLVAYRDVL
jgi:hypothetical protein